MNENATVIGTKSVEAIDPNVLNRKVPHTLFKDDTNSYYVQNGKVFSLNGTLVADSETSKQELWRIQQTDMGREVLKYTGLEVTLAEAETEKTGTETFSCEICTQSFLSKKALGSHNKIHSGK